ncbi:hypothetical protein B0H13DRAFT_2460066 [Mycena leptocephala]|nr:hypothetical protein B0H13DRAFT_2460066 [Mycena leptocephala]
MTELDTGSTHSRLPRVLSCNRRPPQPCPPYPTEPAARTAQGLPALFVPTPFPGTAGPSTSVLGTSASIFGGVTGGASTSTAAAITDPARLPLPQTFSAPVSAPESERFVSIAAAGEYSHWSHEELRYHAYLRGMRAPPPGMPMFPLEALPAPTAAQIPSFPGLPVAPLPAQNDGDQFQTITCRPEFAGHSVEELRLSFLRTGAELTSAQIFAGLTSAPSTSINPLAPPVNPFAPPSASAPAPGLFSTPQQPSIFGAQTAQPAFGVQAAQPIFAPRQPVQAVQQQPQSIFGGGAQTSTWGTQPTPQQQQPTPISTPGGCGWGVFVWRGSLLSNSLGRERSRLGCAAAGTASAASRVFVCRGAGAGATACTAGRRVFVWCDTGAGGGSAGGTGFSFGGRRGF